MELQDCTRCGVMCEPYYTAPMVEQPDGSWLVKKGAETRWCHMCWLSYHVCLDCKINTNVIHEYYKITDALWCSVVEHGRGMLCIGCLERRIDRLLTSSDFSDAPINHNDPDWPKSPRLMNRLGFD